MSSQKLINVVVVIIAASVSMNSYIPVYKLVFHSYFKQYHSMEKQHTGRSLLNKNCGIKTVLCKVIMQLELKLCAKISNAHCAIRFIKNNLPHWCPIRHGHGGFGGFRLYFWTMKAVFLDR